MPNKEALGKFVGPRILHIATDGFFLEDLPKPQPVSFEDEALQPSAGLPAATENPMLRSGLALTGANGPDGCRSEGILTAMEATSLDLRGTQLVVMRREKYGASTDVESHFGSTD